jgi:hypothetical protein
MRRLHLVCLAATVILASSYQTGNAIPMTGMTLWLDASDINADGIDNNPADGTEIGTAGVNPWISNVGGLQAIEPTDVPEFNRFPHFLNDGINGKPALDFHTVQPGDTEDGFNNDALLVEGFNIDVTKPYTAFVVMQYEIPSDGTFFSTANPFSGENGELLRIKNDGQLRTFPGSGGVFSDFPGPVPGASIIAYNNNSVADGGPGAAECWVDGSTVFITSNMTRSSTASHDLTIGMAQTPVPSGADPFTAFKGQIAEEIFYDRTLTPDELNEVGYYLEQKYGLDTAYTPPVVGGPTGDYNENGTVDAADYVLWRDTLGQSVTSGSGADGDESETIDAGDHDFWKARFGNSVPSAAASLNAVPEPTAVFSIVAALSGLAFGLRRKALLCKAGSIRCRCMSQFHRAKGRVF